MACYVSSSCSRNSKSFRPWHFCTLSILTLLFIVIELQFIGTEDTGVQIESLTPPEGIDIFLNDKTCILVVINVKFTIRVLLKVYLYRISLDRNRTTKLVELEYNKYSKLFKTIYKTDGWECMILDHNLTNGEGHAKCEKSLCTKSCDDMEYYQVRTPLYSSNKVTLTVKPGLEEKINSKIVWTSELKGWLFYIRATVAPGVDEVCYYWIVHEYKKEEPVKKLHCVGGLPLMKCEDRVRLEYSLPIDPNVCNATSITITNTYHTRKMHIHYNGNVMTDPPKEV